MVSTEVISWESHCRWFAEQLAARDTFWYMAELETAPAPSRVGHIRWTPADDSRSGVADVVVAPDRRGLGLGTELIKLGTELLFSETEWQKALAMVRSENQASRVSFTRAGFGLVDERDGYAFFERHRPASVSLE